MGQLQVQSCLSGSGDEVQRLGPRWGLCGYQQHPGEEDDQLAGGRQDSHNQSWRRHRGWEKSTLGSDSSYNVLRFIHQSC